MQPAVANAIMAMAAKRRMSLGRATRAAGSRLNASPIARVARSHHGRGYRATVRRILVTGMSGTGKSTALAELALRGFRVVETDEPGWKQLCDGEWMWREDRIAELLAADGDRTLYVSGCVPNQGRFYDRFDAVVLLSAPARVILSRIANRTTNDFGKSRIERAQILSDLESTEPRLRATCTHEIDTTRPVGDVVDELIAVGLSG